MGKLVRDLIPRIIRDSGRQPQTRILGADEYRRALLIKLLEESEELTNADEASVAEEMADVLEVLRAVAELDGIAWDRVETLRLTKLQQRGGFTERIYLE